MGNTESYKIILADDHEIFRLGLRAVLEADPQFKIVAEARDGVELMELLKSVECNLVILDLTMPEMDGFSILDAMAIGFHGVKRLVVSMHTDRDVLVKAMAKGLHGFVNKKDAADVVPLAVRRIKGGERFFSQDVQELILSNFDEIVSPSRNGTPLTCREKEIANHVAAGLISKQIATQLNISIHTVQFHRSNIMKKLKLKNTADLVKYVMEHPS